MRLIIFWDWVTSNLNPVIFGKQRAKVSWMSGVSRGGPRGLVSSVLSQKDHECICIHDHVCSLLDLSILLREILICKENKHHQKDGKYKESVIIKVGKAGLGSFPHTQMDSVLC